MVVRIYYRSTCQSGDDNYQFAFPQINVQAPTKGEAGLASIRQIFRGDSGVEITEDRPGIVSIRIGVARDEILRTRISYIAFEPMEQFNHTLAIRAIQHALEVRMAERKLGLSAPTKRIVGLMVMPSDDLPHLPPSMTNVTMDQALDEVSRRLNGIVLYGSCDRMFSVDFLDRAQRDFAE